MKGADRHGAAVESVRPPRRDLADLERIRDALMWAMRKRGYRLRELGFIFGIGAATAFRALDRMTPEEKASAESVAARGT